MERAKETLHDLRVFLRTLARQRFLSEPVPAPVRRASDVHDEAAGGARAPSARLPGAGPLVSIAARVRDPAPAASCIFRYRARPSLAPVLPQRPADDASHQGPL